MAFPGLTTPRLGGKRPSRIHIAATALGIWMLAAVLVAAAQEALRPSHPVLALFLSLALLLMASFLYEQTEGWETGAKRASLLGVAWLVLSIAAELAVAFATGRPWYALLGTPDEPGLRAILMLGWVCMPLLLVHRRRRPH